MPAENNAEWRKRCRAELIARRMALSEAELARYREAIDTRLRDGFPELGHGIVAFCWPYKNEYDARFLMREMRERGARTALPVVVAPRTPLIFREWHPGVRLENGVYDIPYPANSETLAPDWILLPMNAFDNRGYRLGYGGGFFDRTLAAARPKPKVIGLAYEMGRVESIFPEAHDLPMDYVVTETAIYETKNGCLERMDGSPARNGRSGQK